MLVSLAKNKRALKGMIGREPLFLETSFFGEEYKGDGEYTVVGPGIYIRKYYATVVVKGGKIVKVS